MKNSSKKAKGNNKNSKSDPTKPTNKVKLREHTSFKDSEKKGLD